MEHDSHDFLTVYSPFSNQVLKPSFYFLFLRSSFGGSATFLLSFFFGFIWLLPLGVTTANHLSQSHPIPRILLCHTNPLYVFFLYTHPPTFSVVSQLHFLFGIFTMPPLHMRIPSQPCLSNFVSKPLNLSCPSDILISNPVSLCSLQMKILASCL